MISVTPADKQWALQRQQAVIHRNQGMMYIGLFLLWWGVSIIRKFSKNQREICMITFPFLSL